MDVERIADLAQAVAELQAGEKDYFEGVLADARVRIDEDAEASRLKELSDVKAVAFVIWNCTTHCRSSNDEKALRLLRAAGFERFPAEADPVRLTTIIIDDKDPVEISGPGVNNLIGVLDLLGHKVKRSKSV